MDEDELPDLSREPEPPSEHVNHLAYIFLALIVMLVFWYGTG